LVWDQENQIVTWWEPGDIVEMRGPLGQVLNIGVVQDRAAIDSGFVLVKDIDGKIAPWPWSETGLRY